MTERKQDKMKRFLAILLAAVTLLGLAACGNGGTAQNGDKITITMTYWNSQDTMQPLIDLIEEKLSDIKIQYNYVSNASYSMTTSTKLLGGNADDIIAFSVGEELDYGRQGLLADVSALYNDDFTHNVGDTVDGKNYYVPMNTWYEGIYYNKDIFAQHNIEVPTTFDEFLAVCAKLESVGVQPFTIGAKGGDSLVKCSLGYITSEYLLQDAGKEFDYKFSQGQVKMAEAWKPYVDKWSKIITEGYINTDHLGINDNQAMDEFVTGIAAMYPSGTWAYNTIKKKNFNMNFGLMPYLGDSPENACVVGGAGGGFCLNAKSKNYDAAYRVMEVIASPEGQKAMAAGSPGSGSQHKDVGYELPAEFAAVQTVLDNGRIYCAWHNWGDAACFGTYGSVLQELVLGTKSVQGALEKVDEVAAEYLENAE